MADLGLEETVMSLGRRGSLGFSVLRFWSMFIVNCGFGRSCLAVLIAEVCGFIRFHIFFICGFGPQARTTSTFISPVLRPGGVKCRTTGTCVFDILVESSMFCGSVSQTSTCFPIYIL